MKKILVMAFTLAFSVVLMGCSGGNNSSAASSSSSEEAATSSAETEVAASSEPAETEAAASSEEAVVEEEAPAATLEEYFDSHPSTNTLFLSSFETEFENTEGIDGSVEVKGNDIVITMDFTEMYTEAGITDASLARGALEETGVESVESSIPELAELLQNIEELTGISGARLVYYYIFNGEQVFEMSVDSSGNIGTGEEVAAAA